MWHVRLLVWREKVCGWHMDTKQRELGIQGHVINDFSRPPLRLFLSPSLPFGPFCIVLDDNPWFLSECPMFNHHCHYSLTTRWNGKQGWPVSSSVDVLMRPPAEMKALATCHWRGRNCGCKCLCVAWISQFCEDQSKLKGRNKGIVGGLQELIGPHKYFNIRHCVRVLGCVFTSVLCNKFILHVSLSNLSFIHINESAMC